MHEESIISHRDVSLWKMLALHHGTSCKRGPERVSPSTNSQIDARLRRYLPRYSQIELGSQGQTPICPNAVSCKETNAERKILLCQHFTGSSVPFSNPSSVCVLFSIIHPEYKPTQMNTRRHESDWMMSWFCSMLDGSARTWCQMTGRVNCVTCTSTPSPPVHPALPLSCPP